MTLAVTPKVELLLDDPTHFSTGTSDDEEIDPNNIIPSQQGVISTSWPIYCTDTDSDNESKIPVGKTERPTTSFSEMPISSSEHFRVKSEEPIYDLAVPNFSNQRRIRQIFDCVFLPTSGFSYRNRQAEEATEDYKKLKLLKDPKIKKNFAALLPKTLRDRLKPIGLDIQDQYFTIDQVTRETMVTRYFMSSKYGGNMQMTCPNPSKIFLDKHGMDDFMYLPTEYQPEAPQLPGAPGLWLDTISGEDMEKPMRVFVQVVLAAGSKKSVYQYQGQYEVHAANALTVQEWCDQPPRFHNKWARAIAKMGWGSHVCARILLRRELNREPKLLEVEDVVLSGRYKIITPEEVKEAYFQGKERMGVWTMKCVGYDNRFQSELHETFPTWVPPPPKKRKRQDEAPNPTERRKRRVVEQKSHGNVISDADSDLGGEVGEDEASYSDDDDTPKPKRIKMDYNVIELLDEEAHISYKPRGTRSRPILL